MYRLGDEDLFQVISGRLDHVDSAVDGGNSFTALIPENRGAGGEDVFAEAGNEFFFRG